MINQTTSSNMNTQKHISFGLRLTSCREALGIDKKEAASQLRLPEKIITLLESGEFETSANLPLTFLRGYIRSYSKLLAIPDVEVKEALDSLTPTPQTIQEELEKSQSQLTLSSSTKKFTPSRFMRFLMQLLKYLVGLTIIVLVGFSWFTHKTKIQQDTTSFISKNIESLVDQPQEIKKQNANKLSEFNIDFFLNQKTIDFILIGLLIAGIGFIYLIYPHHKKTKGRSRKISKRHPNLFIKPNFIFKVINPSHVKKFAALLALLIVAGLSFFGFNKLQQQQKHVANPIAQVKSKPKTIVAEQQSAMPNINVEANLETLAPSPNINKALTKEFKIYALPTLVNQLSAYIEKANEFKFALTDPSTPIGQFTYLKKKFYRHRSYHARNRYHANKKIPPYYLYQ